MKEFKNLVISGDTLKVICADTESGEEAVEFDVELKPFYFAENQDLEHNFFSTDSSWSLGDGDDEKGKIEAGTPVNEEFMGQFLWNVTEEVVTMLEDNGITVNFYGWEEGEDEHERKWFHICDFLEAAIKTELHIDDTWHKTAPCRFSDEDAAVLRSVGIDPYSDVPREVLEMVKMGCPVFGEVPQFLKDEEF